MKILIALLQLSLSIMLFYCAFKELRRFPLEEWCYIFLPKEIYEDTKMNYFGCVVCSLLIIFLTPFFCIPTLLYTFIYWLFHVGREK